MTPHQNAEMDCLLSSWHAWQRGEKMTEGFADTAPVVGEFRGYALQYESQVDQQYANADSEKWATMNFQVEQMGDPYKSAIYADARNLWCGLEVWNSPRLPKDPEVRAIILAASRDLLMIRLRNVGVGEWLIAA